ncbi:MAG: TrmH family RNA methyltransferase [Patescibacteria group bacterium]
MREIIIVLHNIRSLHNVGSIFRTADAAGVSKIYLAGITPEPTDRLGRIREPLRKVSLGAEKTVLWEHVPSTSTIFKKLKSQGYIVCALEQSKKSIGYTTLPKRIRKIVLVVGNEVRGLPPSVLKKSDYILEIPMRGAMVRQAHHPRRSQAGKESLNVSVAVGVALFELIRS